MRGFAVEAFGSSWWFDTTRIDENVAAELARLWSRAAARAGTAEAASGETGTAEAARGETDRIVFTVHPWGSSPVQEPDRDVADYAILPQDADQAPYAVSRAFTVAAIRRHAGRALMFHAVGMAGSTGAVVALVGRSGTGKTTAATRLGRHLGYVTDETVVAEPAGLVVQPYPKPLSIITDPQRPAEKSEHSPDELELREAPGPLRLRTVVVLVRDPAAPAPTLEPIGVIEATLAVLPETSSLPLLPGALGVLARALTGHGGPYRLTYAEIDDCLDIIAGLSEPHPDRDGTAPEWLHVRGTPAEPGPDAVPDRLLPAQDVTGGEVRPSVDWESRLVRGAFDDGLISDGEAVLLRGYEPIHLSGLGALLWMHAQTPITVGQLHKLAVDTLGDYPDSQLLVREAAQSLLALSVLVLAPEDG